MDERKIAELVLKSAIDYAVVATDLERNVTFWNIGAERLLGWSSEEMLGRPVDIFFTEEDRRAGIPDNEAETALREGSATDERWHLRKDGSRFWGSGEMLPLIMDGAPTGLVKIVRDQTAKRLADELQETLNTELVHRAKNLMAMVVAIVRQSFRDRSDITVIRDLVIGRVTALAEAQQLLLAETADQTDVSAVLDQALKVHRQGRSGGIVLEGPHLSIGRDAALSLSLIAHELATNAVKYGALSVPTGSVHASWRTVEMEGEPMLELSWAEHGGPPVSPPSRRGLGTTLIEAGIAGAAGDVEIEYRPEGFRCRILAMLETLNPTSGREYD